MEQWRPHHEIKDERQGTACCRQGDQKGQRQDYSNGKQHCSYSPAYRMVRSVSPRKYGLGRRADLIGFELVDVPQVTEGPPHLLYDLHLFEIGLERVGGGAQGIDQRLTAASPATRASSPAARNVSPTFGNRSCSCRTVSVASRWSSRTARAASASSLNCSASFLADLTEMQSSSGHTRPLSRCFDEEVRGGCLRTIEDPSPPGTSPLPRDRTRARAPQIARTHVGQCVRAQSVAPPCCVVAGPLCSCL